MAYNEQLANTVREKLTHLPEVQEKNMFQGLTFMINEKMCIGVREEEIMFRVDPNLFEELVERRECRPMIHGKRTIKGYFFVTEDGYRNKENFEFWIKLALDYNPRAKASKNKR